LDENEGVYARITEMEYNASLKEANTKVYRLEQVE
jgi:hypothetical protein